MSNLPDMTVELIDGNIIVEVAPETPQELELAVVTLVNIKPDWEAEPGSNNEILNQPNLGTAAAANVADFVQNAGGVANLIALTRSEFDAISTKSPTTFYLVTD